MMKMIECTHDDSIAATFNHPIFSNPKTTHEYGGKKQKKRNICDAVYLNPRLYPCKKRHHCNRRESGRNKTNEEKRPERSKVKYYYEKGKSCRHVDKCEKHTVKVSNISKYNVAMETNEYFNRKHTLSSNDLIICQNYGTNNFLWKKSEKNCGKEIRIEFIRNQKNEVEGNDNTNWVYSMNGDSMNAKITVNDKLKDEDNETKHVDVNLNDNVGEQNDAGNIISDKSTPADTLFNNINLHSVCHLTKRIPKQLLRIGRLSKEIIEEEILKRTKNKKNETERPTKSWNQRNEMKRVSTPTKSFIALCFLNKNFRILSSYYLHSTAKDELKDNALEEEEELKDELGEMGSNISRHSGKGLSGRRTQSSGNLCNGKLVSNVGKLLVPCTKQGEDLTSPNSTDLRTEELKGNLTPNFGPKTPKIPRSFSCATLLTETVDELNLKEYSGRYKLCASLPNYLEKENLDDLEPCKFPYGINNNNNNNKAGDFFSLVNL
uniref:Uncharacterized protein n=1 Tax=Cacopsylla melanoneura TaxID=428564 RepID=A0A8D8LN44_9HEMI